jgi:hypothetical protein
MKKLFVLFLLITGTGTTLLAQLRDLPNRTESLFDNPPPGKSNAQFTFYLSNNIRILFECDYISQLEQVPDLDSLVKQTILLLNPLADSLKEDGVVRRVDIVLVDAIPKIRIISHPQFSNTYTIKDDELMQLKVNQDTIRIIGLSKSRIKWNVIGSDGNKTIQDRYSNISVTIVLNNIADINTLPPDALKNCMAILQPKVENFYKRDGHNSPPYKYNASFNMRTGRMFSPVDVSYIPSGNERISGILGFSLTAVRGAVAPSVQAGIAFNKTNNFFSTSFRFYIERQYFFQRDLNNKLTISPNTFGVFQIWQSEKKSAGNALAFSGNLSLGYLFSRRGNWYEPNTWRIGLPVLKNRHISIEPHLVFNDFFKNVSPSIKITFNF